MTHPPDFRALLIRARQKFQDYEMAVDEPAPYEHRKLMDEIDAALSAVPRQGAPSDRELQWPPSVAQGCREAAVEAEMGSPLQQLLVAAGDLLESYGARAVPVAASTRYEFSVFAADDDWQASGDAPTLEQAIQEGQYYMAQFSGDHDGPYRLELRRVEVLPLPEAQP